MGSEMCIRDSSIYVALGIGLNGQKEVLGLWMSKNEGAQFWLKVLSELKKRGVEDFLFICIRVRLRRPSVPESPR